MKLKWYLQERANGRSTVEHSVSVQPPIRHAASAPGGGGTHPCRYQGMPLLCRPSCTPVLIELRLVAVFVSCRDFEESGGWLSSLQEIRAEGRRFPALAQVEMQRAVRAFLSKLEQIDPQLPPTSGESAPCLFHACMHACFISMLMAEFISQNRLLNS